MLAGAEQRRAEPATVDDPAEIRRRIEGGTADRLATVEGRLAHIRERAGYHSRNMELLAEVDVPWLLVRIRDAEQRAERLVDAIRDIDVHATPFGLADPEDPDGNPHHYVLTVGALHRALGAAEGRATAAKCGTEAERELKAAAMQRDAYRRIREEAEHWAARAAELHERVEMLEAESGRQARGLLEAGQRAAVLQAERDQARALARWLVALDEPDNAERRTVTLAEVIDRARAVLAGPADAGYDKHARPRGTGTQGGYSTYYEPSVDDWDWVER